MDTGPVTVFRCVFAVSRSTHRHTVQTSAQCVENVIEFIIVCMLNIAMRVREIISHTSEV